MRRGAKRRVSLAVGRGSKSKGAGAGATFGCSRLRFGGFGPLVDGGKRLSVPLPFYRVLPDQRVSSGHRPDHRHSSLTRETRHEPNRSNRLNRSPEAVTINLARTSLEDRTSHSIRHQAGPLSAVNSNSELSTRSSSRPVRSCRRWCFSAAGVEQLAVINVFAAVLVVALFIHGIERRIAADNDLQALPHFPASRMALHLDLATSGQVKPVCPRL